MAFEFNNGNEIIISTKKQKVRVLRPNECERLILAIPKSENRKVFQSLLYTGMRYIEMIRFQKHPKWFDGDFVHLPASASKKVKRKQIERWVRLNQTGKSIIRDFIDIKKPLTDYKTWSDDLKRWAGYAGISPKALGSKTTRKTWESWLVFYYEEKLIKILDSQGHDETTAIKHYLNLPFTEQDRQGMKNFVEGWG